MVEMTMRKFGKTYFSIRPTGREHALVMLAREYLKTDAWPTPGEVEAFLRGSTVSRWGREFRLVGVSRQADLFGGRRFGTESLEERR